MLTFAKLDAVSHENREANVLINMAYENASDTVFVEKARRPEELEAVFMDTLICVLAYETRKHVIDWFAAKGISA